MEAERIKIKTKVPKVQKKGKTIMKDFDRLNRETHHYNTVGNHHHHSNTGIKHPTNFANLNRETYAHNNKISVHSIYESYGRN